MASKTSAGKGKKGSRKNPSSPDMPAKSAKKKITISGGRIVDVEAQQPTAGDLENDQANAQFQSRLRVMLLFLVALMLIIPYCLNFEMSTPDSANPEINTENFLKMVSSGSTDTIGQVILGASIETLVGNQGTPPKGCAIFYSDDPEFNPKALASRICPETTDNHISFHIKGVFRTHPNNTNLVKGEKAAKVKFVAAGKDVWTHFFDQHNATTQTFIVAPGNDIDILTLTGTQISKFYENFDSIRIINTANTVGFRFKGPQPAYPDCVSYFGTNPVVANTDGFMICHPQKTKYVEMKPGNGELESLWHDMDGRIKSISYVQVGKRVTSFLDFEKNPGMERITMEAGSAHDLIKECKPSDAGAPIPELRPKFLKVTTTDPNIKGTTSSKRYNTGVKGGPDGAVLSTPAPVLEEGGNTETVETPSRVSNDASSFRSQSSKLKSLDDLDPVISRPSSESGERSRGGEGDEEDADIFESKPISSTSSSLSPPAASSSGVSSSSTKKRQTDDDEQR